MFQAAVFNACQIPFKSGFPSAVRRSVDTAAGGWAAAGTPVSQTIARTAATPVIDPPSLFIMSLAANVTRRVWGGQGRDRRCGFADLEQLRFGTARQVASLCQLVVGLFDKYMGHRTLSGKWVILNFRPEEKWGRRATSPFFRSIFPASRNS